MHHDQAITITTTITIDHGGLSTIHDVTCSRCRCAAASSNPDEILSLDRGARRQGRPEHPAAEGHHALKDDPERYVVQGVHMIIEGDHQRAWKEGEKRESRLVFIGRNLPEDKIRQGFESCTA